MSFSTPRFVGGLLVSGALAFEPALARAQPPVSAEPPDAGPSETAAVPPPRPVAEERAPAPPSESLRTCSDEGREVCRPRMIGGSVVLGLGVAAAAAGVALTFVKSKPVADDPASERTFMPAALVLTGASVLAITLGAMLIGDAVQRRRGPRARLARRTP